MAAPLVIPIIMLGGAIVGRGAEVAKQGGGAEQREHEASLAQQALSAEAKRQQKNRKRRQRKARRQRKRAEQEAARLAQEAQTPTNIETLLPIGAGAAVLAALAYTVGSKGG